MFSYGNFLLWNNEAITIEKKMLFWKSCFNKKILFIQDILNADVNFLTFEDSKTSLVLKQIIVPSDLKKKARSAEVPSHEQLLNSTIVFLFPKSTPVDLLNMRCKYYYKMLNKIRIPQWSQPALKPGKSSLPTNIQNGKTNFHLYNYCSATDNKLRQFSFKLLQCT